ncbi:hypothetical protein Syncc9605_1522 [Synechococcus sp. CC9605]|nr:hypothetical protein Syncc9605_1522 [Synechococcus sp. CC9605]
MFFCLLKQLLQPDVVHGVALMPTHSGHDPSGVNRRRSTLLIRNGAGNLLRIDRKAAGRCGHWRRFGSSKRRALQGCGWSG